MLDCRGHYINLPKNIKEMDVFLPSIFFIAKQIVVVVNLTFYYLASNSLLATTHLDNYMSVYIPLQLKPCSLVRCHLENATLFAGKCREKHVIV